MTLGMIKINVRRHIDFLKSNCQISQYRVYQMTIRTPRQVVNFG